VIPEVRYRDAADDRYRDDAELAVLLRNLLRTAREEALLVQ
jgi:hypothetical protein